jgi:hypothetical protein
LGKLTGHFHTNQAHAHVDASLPQPQACSYANGATGENITSYKWLMHDPTTAETWKMAFRKDFSGMAQGDLKTGQKSTNSIFVMTHDEISRILQNQMVTYAHAIVNF